MAQHSRWTAQQLATSFLGASAWPRDRARRVEAESDTQAPTSDAGAKASRVQRTAGIGRRGDGRLCRGSLARELASVIVPGWLPPMHRRWRRFKPGRAISAGATMGTLHGPSRFRTAPREQAERVVVSIFVVLYPRFGPREDFRPLSVSLQASVGEECAAPASKRSFTRTRTRCTRRVFRPTSRSRNWPTTCAGRDGQVHFQGVRHRGPPALSRLRLADLYFFGERDLQQQLRVVQRALDLGLRSKSAALIVRELGWSSLE